MTRRLMTFGDARPLLFETKQLPAAPDGGQPASQPEVSPEERNQQGWARRRSELLKFAGPMLRSKDLAEERGSSTVNPSSHARALRGRIFGVKQGNEWQYPQFQFDLYFNPLDIVAELLNILPADSTGWSTLQWFIEPNRCVDGKAPKDVLGEASCMDQLRRAARMNTSEGDVY